MTLAPLDPRPALVVVDLQKGIATGATAHPWNGVVENSARLADAFRAQGLPVVLVNAAGGAPGRTAAVRPARTRPPGWTDLVDELRADPSDHRVTKRTWGSFTGTDLHEHLTAAGATQIVLTGVATSIGVESTARAAYELGYNVVLVTDAMTDRDPDSHDASVQRIFPRLGEPTTTDEVLAALAGRGAGL